MAENTANEFKNFDIDDFDWGDEEIKPIPVDSIAPNLHEMMQAAIGHATIKPKKVSYATRGEDKLPGQEVRRMVYYMPVEKREYFEEHYPTLKFQWETAYKHTDHPRSRLARELTESEMVDPILGASKPYIDYCGSGSRNVKAGRNAITLYAKFTPKDYLSYQRTQVGDRILDWKKLISGLYEVEGKRVHDLCITHALYYLSLKQIGEFVNAHPMNRVHATVHRHREAHGFLNGGEQEYWVSEKGDVTQRNTRTGETYSHVSMEALFHQWSAKTMFGGVAWTARELPGDTFLMEFVGCPNKVAAPFVALSFLQPESRSVTSTNNMVVKTFLGWTWMSTRWNGQEVLLDNVELLEKLRLYISGRKRSPAEKTALWNHARRLCNERDVISMHGGNVMRIDSQSLMVHYVECAFYMDVRRELEVAISYAQENNDLVVALNKYYETGIAPTTHNLTSKVIKVAVGAITGVGSWPVQKLINTCAPYMERFEQTGYLEERDAARSMHHVLLKASATKAVAVMYDHPMKKTKPKKV